MPERLAEFNRLELKRKLQEPEEENELVDEVREMVKSHFGAEESLELNPEHIRNILNWSVNRITKLSDLLSSELKFIWVAPKEYKISDNELKYVTVFIDDLSQVPSLHKENLNHFFRQFSQKHQLKFGNFMKMLRSVLSGLKEGPSVAEIVEILGKQNTIKRLQSCVRQK